jgi:hypothetical protein
MCQRNVTCKRTSNSLTRSARGRTSWTGDFKCREVKTGFCRNRSMKTGSSGTLIGWISGQTTFVPLWDRMEGAWLWTQGTFFKFFPCMCVCSGIFPLKVTLIGCKLILYEDITAWGLLIFRDLWLYWTEIELHVCTYSNEWDGYRRDS